MEIKENENNRGYLLELDVESLRPVIERIVDSRIQDITNELKSNYVSSSTQDICQIEEAMKITGLAKQTIYQKVWKNEIPFHKKGKRLYFMRSELHDWILAGNKRQ